MRESFTTPGGIDLHVHLREPSTNTSETIASGTRAALLGGYVLVADMPNNPGMPVWSRERLDVKVAIAEREAWIPTAFYAGSQPESDNIGELARMASHAIGLKLYGDPTTGNSRTYEASAFVPIIEEWHRVAPNKPIMFHAGSENLEDMINVVSGNYDHHLHVCHVNDPDQVALVVEAVDADKPVTCGVCPHHLLKTSHDFKTQGVFAEMKPPLAHQTDAEELMYLLENGNIDVIETDYAPHGLEAKYAAEHDEGHCYGVGGIEHVLPLLFYQVHKGNLTMPRLIEATHDLPAMILGFQPQAGTLVEWDNSGGAYRIGEDDVKSNHDWSPYMGMLAIGKVDRVKIGGWLIAEEGEPYSKLSVVVQKRNEE